MIQRCLAYGLIICWLITLPLQSLHACMLAQASLVDQTSQSASRVAQHQLRDIVGHWNDHVDSDIESHTKDHNKFYVVLTQPINHSPSFSHSASPNEHHVSKANETSSSLPCHDNGHVEIEENAKGKPAKDCPDHCVQGGYCSNASSALLLTDLSPKIVIERPYYFSTASNLPSVDINTLSPPPKS